MVPMDSQRKQRTEPSIRQHRMGAMPIGRLVVSMSIPAIVSMTIQAVYVVIDSIFVARLGENALAAISLVYPVQMLMVAVGVGTNVGVNSLIARRLGEKNPAAAGSAATHGFLLSFVSGGLFGLFGLFGVDAYMSAFSDTKAVLAYGTAYLSIITLYSAILFLQFSIEKILQAMGNMTVPMVTSLIGAVVKIALNPILLFGLLGAPELGIRGAAIATVIGNSVTVLLGLLALFGRPHPVRVRLRGFRYDPGTLAAIFAVGVPAIIMQSITSVLIAGFNIILAGFSESAVAVLGVYFRLQNFVFMPVFGLTQGAMPILGFNYGAREKDRLMAAFRISLLGALLIMAGGLLAFQLWPGYWLSLFNATPQMLLIGIPALRILSLCFLPAAVGILCATLFQSTGHGVQSLIVSLFRQLLLTLPLAFLLARFIGVGAVWWSIPLAEALAMGLSLLLLRYLYEREIKDL